MFVDRSRQEEFDHQGYCVVRLMTGAQARTLHRRYDELAEHAVIPPSTAAAPPARFDHSAFHPDASHRQLAEQLCTAAIGEPLLGQLGPRPER